MIATVQFNIDVRRKDDTAALTAELEKLFRQHTVGDDEITIITDTRKRGGIAVLGGDRG